MSTAKIVRTPLERLCAPRRAILTIVAGLYLNVIVPAHAGPNSKLPVVVVCIMYAVT